MHTWGSSARKQHNSSSLVITVLTGISSPAATGSALHDHSQLSRDWWLLCKSCLMYVATTLSIANTMTTHIAQRPNRLAHALTAQHITTHHITPQHSISHHSTSHQSTATRLTIQHNTAQHITLTTYHIKAQHSTTQHSTAQHNTAHQLPAARSRIASLAALLPRPRSEGSMSSLNLPIPHLLTIAYPNQACLHNCLTSRTALSWKA